MCKSREHPLEDDLVIEGIPNVGTLEKDAVSRKRDGVLMVMMEQYDKKCKNFLPSGVIAVALKDTPESKEITDNLHNIGYVLFHVYKDENKHLFIADKRKIVNKEDLESSVYPTINPDNEKVTEYVLVSFNNEFELMSDTIHPQNVTGHTRYDARYSTIESLKSID